ncbi:FAD:protein FMN transferase [Azospirillum sp. INR13]|uniref:FAD:protein FMN transferase n=1 Tax=Azospirillum sp. INR13 TaxID=2596919 RepID=UPI002101ED46|nr:FAD:protein FMN transferase [Azospirillum sp. INR13]
MPTARWRPPAATAPASTRPAASPTCFDPASGACAVHWQAVTVQAPDAATADALSTALSVVPEDRVPAILAAYPGVTARFTHPDGRILRLPA